MPDRFDSDEVICSGFQAKIPLSSRRIITTVQLMPPHMPGEAVQPFDQEYRGLWDTGATTSTIKDSLAKQLQLPCIGQQEMMGAGGPYIANIYLGGLVLPNNVVISSTKLSGFPGCDAFEMLIGMDVILLGDFLVSRENDTIHFSFQYPSAGGFYLKDICQLRLHNGTLCTMNGGSIQSGPKVGRNAPCPCGSGKKYKRCHGGNSWR